MLTYIRIFMFIYTYVYTYIFMFICIYTIEMTCSLTSVRQRLAPNPFDMQAANLHQFGNLHGYVYT